MTVGALLLAAGSARRMGDDKLMADLGGLPLVGHVLRSIGQAGLPRPVVAIAPGSPVARAASGARIVEVADHALGMGHSLAAAIAAAPDDWSAVVICLGDMPFVSSTTLSALATAAAPERIVRPSFDGRSGNPLCWGRGYFAELGNLRGDCGGRVLLDRHVMHVVDLPCDDPGILIDIDTPAALARARARF